MKKISFLIILVGSIWSCTNISETTEDTKPQVIGTPAVPAKKTTIQWLDSTRNVGKVTEGEKIELTYRFVNTGNEPLIVESVQVSCGCTVAEKPAPVMPGKEGFIKAVFDSHGRSGTQHKSITVYANTEAMIYPLTFDVDVIAKK
jgi:hypothetical protein